ncbi:MAG: hypothetical protein ACI8V5_003287 [Limisphaerales bacterium]
MGTIGSRHFGVNKVATVTRTVFSEPASLLMRG